MSVSARPFQPFILAGDLPFHQHPMENTIPNLKCLISCLFADLLTIPPGFERGIKFKADGRTPLQENKEQEALSSDVESLVPEMILDEKMDSTAINLISLIKQEEDLLGLRKEETKEDERKQTGKISLQNLEVDIDADVAEVVPKVH
jgi:hypothetical protein